MARHSVVITNSQDFKSSGSYLFSCHTLCMSFKARWSSGDFSGYSVFLPFKGNYNFPMRPPTKLNAVLTRLSPPVHRGYCFARSFTTSALRVHTAWHWSTFRSGMHLSTKKGFSALWPLIPRHNLVSAFGNSGSSLCRVVHQTNSCLRHNQKWEQGGVSSLLKTVLTAYQCYELNSIPLSSSSVWLFDFSPQTPFVRTVTDISCLHLEDRVSRSSSGLGQ